jgi:hypothetical protein
MCYYVGVLEGQCVRSKGGGHHRVQQDLKSCTDTEGRLYCRTPLHSVLVSLPYKLHVTAVPLHSQEAAHSKGKHDHLQELQGQD